MVEVTRTGNAEGFGLMTNIPSLWSNNLSLYNREQNMSFISLVQILTNGVSMKHRMAILLANTMFLIGGVMSASATVSNTNGQKLKGEQQSTQLLATKGKGKYRQR